MYSKLGKYNGDSDLKNRLVSPFAMDYFKCPKVFYIGYTGKAEKKPFMIRICISN